MMKNNLKNIRFVDITTYHPIKTKIGNLSRQIEFKIEHSNSDRKLISDGEIYNELREIIKLIEKL